MASRVLELVRGWLVRSWPLQDGFVRSWPTRSWAARSWLGAVALGALVSCGSGSAGGAAQKAPSGGGGACLDQAAKGSLCETLVSHFTRCTETSTSKQHLTEDCQATWGGFSERVNGCFVQKLGECLSGPCDSVDAERCFWAATVASDPDSFDATSRKACLESGQCDGVPDGWMGRCAQRFDECSADADLCATAVSLQRRFRGEVDGCLAEECGTLEDCVYAAMGNH